MGDFEVWIYVTAVTVGDLEFTSSLVAQMIQNLPAMQETRVWFLGWEVPLEKGMTPAPVFLPGEFHGPRSLGGYSPWGHKELDMTEQLQLSSGVYSLESL